MKNAIKYFVSVISGSILSVIFLGLILTHLTKSFYLYDYPYYDNLEDMCEKSNQIVMGTIVSYNGIKSLDVGEGKTDYHIYSLEVEETYKGDADVGDIIKIRIFDLKDEDDQPFEVDCNYICFLWDTDENPAVLLNRNQAELKLEENDIIVTDDAYAALEDLIKEADETTTANDQNDIQVETIKGEYEDRRIENGESLLVETIKEMSGEKD